MGHEPVMGIGHGRAAELARGVVGPGPQEQAVGVGPRLDRAVIGVAEGEGVGQGELEGQIFGLVVAHGMLGLGDRPAVHAAVVPGALRIRPQVRRALDPHVGEALAGVEVEGGDDRRAGGLIRLGEHGGALQALGVRHGDREAVAEAAHAGQRAEVVIEAAVLLHEDHHVLDVADRAGADVGVDGLGARDGREQARGAGGEQERAAVEGGHEAYPVGFGAALGGIDYGVMTEGCARRGISAGRLFEPQFL